MSGKVGSLLVAACVAFACGNSPSSPGEAFCKGYCKFAERCGVASADVCPSECFDDRPGLAMLSIEGAGRLGDCVSGFDCSTVTDDDLWKSDIQACSVAAAAAITPTPRLRSFCTALSEAWFDCNTVLSTSDCLDQYGIFSDTVLDELGACTEPTSCDTLKSCVEGVLQ
ncbi:MAG TPA: hypothetical protein VMI54_30115 [Polyangiaceae bacterium]|nr:hypothetical protein [Polyangiaceae bacterium]